MPNYDENTPEKPTQWRVVENGYVPEVEVKLVPKLPAGVYRVEPIGWVWGVVPSPLITDKLVKEGNAPCDIAIMEIRRFWKLREKYESMGFVHKRGIFFHGPAGTGKTSTAALVAQEVVAEDGLVFILNGVKALVAMLERLRNFEVNRHIVVIIEDIDDHYDVEGDILLSFLDGERSISGVVVIATTNFFEELDARITDRPSRFDRVMCVGAPSPKYREAYLKSRGVELSAEELARWVKDSEGFTVAHLKELIIGVCVLNDPYEDVLARVRDMGKPQAVVKAAVMPEDGAEGQNKSA